MMRMLGMVVGCRMHLLRLVRLRGIDQRGTRKVGLLGRRDHLASIPSVPSLRGHQVKKRKRRKKSTEGKARRRRREEEELTVLATQTS